MRPSKPIEVIIEITGRCQQICPYCTGARIPDVPLKDIQATIDEAVSLKIKAIRITGGEPLIHPAIADILTYAKSKKLDIILNTTAENISPSLMKTIIATVRVAHVSLQGNNAVSNASYTRSKVPFTNKLKNIFHLKAYLPTLWLATVITPAKAKSFSQFIPLIKKINPAAWLLQRPIAEYNDDLKQMDAGFYQNLALQILKVRQLGINAFISNPIPLCLTGNLQTGKKVFRGAQLDEGHLRLVRSAKGFFKASYFLETNLGDTIQSAWSHPYIQDMDRMDYLPEICQRCPVLDICRGGCRAMALRAHGTALAVDPLFDTAIAQKALSTPYLTPSPLKTTV